MTDTRHLLWLWLHHTNHHSGLPQMLHQQLNESPSTRISSLPYLPVVVGGQQGSMHSHSHQITTSRRSRPVQPKKAFELPSTIRAGSNNLLDVHGVVVWIVSGMKELLHFPNQLLPVAIHQTVSTRLPILSDKDASTSEYVLSWCDLPPVWGSIAISQTEPPSANKVILYVWSFQVTYIEVEGWWCHSVQT